MKLYLELDSTTNELTQFVQLLSKFTIPGETPQSIIDEIHSLEKELMSFKQTITDELTAQKADLTALDARVDATAALLQSKIDEIIAGQATQIILTPAEATEIMDLVKGNRALTKSIEAGPNTVEPTPSTPVA